ncbi:hypothetical protein [Mesorhizobium sp.]|nr:hypothetical protein [Mesorhizobium sp.]
MGLILTDDTVVWCEMMASLVELSPFLDERGRAAILVVYLATS